MDQNLQVTSKQERLENWAARITACRGSGMTVRPSGGAAVTVRIAGAEADIYSGTDAATVETVVLLSHKKPDGHINVKYVVLRKNIVLNCKFYINKFI